MLVLQSHKLVGESTPMINRFLKAETLRLLEEHPEGLGDDWASTCGVWHSSGLMNNVLDHDPFSALKVPLMAQLIDYAGELGVDTLSYDVFSPNSWGIDIDEAWVNVNAPGTYQEFHNHAGFHVSGCYYIDVPADSGDFIIRSPHPLVVFPGVNEETDYTAEIEVFRPVAGSLVVFPSMVDHRVTKNESTESRISLAFNATIRPRGS